MYPITPIEQVRTLELERLDAMLQALWPSALKGKWLAIDRCLAIMDRRAILLGLDKAQPPIEEGQDSVDELRMRREARRSTNT